MFVEAKGIKVSDAARNTGVADILDDMRRNPAADWIIGDVLAVCAQHGVRCSPPSGGGSHYKVSHISQRSILTIPRARPVKPVYIRKLVRFIKAVQGGVDAPS